MARSAITTRRRGVRDMPYAVVFNGSSTEGTSDSAIDFSGFTDLTYAFWVWSEESPSSAEIFLELSPNINTNNDVFACSLNTDGSVTASTRTGGNFNNWVGTENIANSQWRRVVVTVQNNTGAGAHDVYVDGAVLGGAESLTNVTPTTWANSKALYMGARNGSSAFFKGKFSQIEFYDDLWSAAEVANDFFDATQPTEPTYRYKFTDGPGTTLTEDIAGENITLANQVWITNTPSKVRNTISTNRPDITAYRVPFDLRALGITSYWDFRTGFSGANSSVVTDMVGDHPMSYRGGTALSSVYTSGEYEADLDDAQPDYFEKLDVNFSSSPITNLSVFAWIWKRTANSRDAIISHWTIGTGINERSFLIEGNSGKFRFIYDEDGAAADNVVYATDNNDIATTGQWFFVGGVFNPSAAPDLYVDNALKDSSQVSGPADPATILNATATLQIGELTSAAGLEFDGKIGICGVAVGKSMSTAEMLQLYNLTKSLGGY